MKTTFLKPLQVPLVSMVLLAAIASSPIKGLANPPNGELTTPDALLNRESSTDTQQPNATPAPKAEIGPTDGRIDELDDRVTRLERDKNTAEQSGFFGISWGGVLNAVSPLLGLTSLLLALVALGRVKKQREEMLNLKGRYQNLLTRLGSVEVQMEQDRIINRNQAIAVSEPTLASTPAPTPPTQPSWTVTQPAVETTPSSPEPISKSTLISALNMGDRHPLRAAANAELNITSESENALAMGKAIATELEEVAGGGSYWLIAAEGQNWLFPTDRTLRGFAAAQPSKGLFHYEQQTISQPKLIEPALLERSGSRWSIKTMGKIAMP